MERVLVGVAELGAVGTPQNGTGVDQIQQAVRHVLAAAVMRQLEEVDTQLRHAPLREQLADRRLKVGGERIAGEEQRHVTYLEQEGDARPVEQYGIDEGNVDKATAW